MKRQTKPHELIERDPQRIELRLPEWLTVEQRDELRRGLQLIFTAMLAAMRVGAER